MSQPTPTHPPSSGAEPIAVKLFTANGDTRRTRLPPNARGYNDLLAAVSRAYNAGAPRLSWTDEDGDDVSIRGNADWNECIAAVAGTSAVRVNVAFAGQPQPVQEVPKPQKPAQQQPGGAGARVNEGVPAGIRGQAPRHHLFHQHPQPGNANPGHHFGRYRQHPIAHHFARRHEAAKANTRSSTANADAEAGGKPAHHRGIRCDVSSQCPIVGTRYHLVGKNYDLCEAEFAKLPEARKAQFEVIKQPRGPRVPYMATTAAGDTVNAVEVEAEAAKTKASPGTIRVGPSVHSSTKRVTLPAPGMSVEAAAANAQHPSWRDRFDVSVNGRVLTVSRVDQRSGWEQDLVLRCVPGSAAAPAAQPSVVTCTLVVHQHVRCDVSKQCPIVGTRYHLIGKNYDLCEAEFAKLPEARKAQFEVIHVPGGPRTPYAPAANSAEGDDGDDNTGSENSDSAAATNATATPHLATVQRTVVVGGSGGNQKSVSLPAAGLRVDPTPCNAQLPDWSDRFEVAVDGDVLTVRRTDQAAGWGQDLVLKCSVAAAGAMQTAWAC